MMATVIVMVATKLAERRLRWATWRFRSGTALRASVVFYDGLVLFG